MNVLQRNIALLCIATGFSAHAQPRPSWPDSGAPLPDAALVEALKGGALTIYFRHASTQHAQADRKDAAVDDCARQRNLSDAGRDEARAIGVALRALALDVDEVLASPYCRTMETARLIAGRATASRAVLGSVHAGRLDYSDLEKILATPAAQGKVRVIVSHGNQLQALAGDPELSEGEAAVIRGDGERWNILARVAPGEWARLAALATPPARSRDAGSARRRSAPN